MSRTARAASLTARRRGSTYLEVQVAFAVLGVALAGLSSIIVAQLRLGDALDDLFPRGRLIRLEPPGRHLVAAVPPPPDPGDQAERDAHARRLEVAVLAADWLRKLGADPAPVVADAPVPDPEPSPSLAEPRDLAVAILDASFAPPLLRVRIDAADPEPAPEGPEEPPPSGGTP